MERTSLQSDALVSWRSVFLPLTLAANALWGLSAGCTSASQLDVSLHQSPRGEVFLERMSDRSFLAAHPIKLDQDIMSKVLRGVYVRNDQSTIMGSLFESAPKQIRAFTDEDIAFLTPHLITALSQAAPDQRVGFSLNHVSATPSLSQVVGADVGSSEPPLTAMTLETSAGTLYAYGLSLYVTLSEYQYRAERADTINMANPRLPDPIGLRNREIFFLPAAALRPEIYKKSGSFSGSEEQTLAIDYQTLANLPEATPPAAVPPPSQVSTPPPPPAAHPVQVTPTQPAPTSAGPASQAQTGQIPESDSRKDSDVEALKEELKALKQKVEQQDAELQKLKKSAKKKPTPKSQESPP